jgi:hypothetical protein
MVLTIFYLSLVAISYIKFRENILYVFPVINLIWRSLAGFIYPYVEGGYSQDLIRVVFIETLLIILISLIYIFKKGNRIGRVGIVIMFIILFFFALLTRASDVWFSFKRILGIVSYLLLFLAVLLNTSNIHQIKLLIKSALIFIIGFEILVLVSTFLKIGIEQLEGQLIRVAGYHFFDMGGFVFTLTLFPIFFEWYKSKRIAILIIYLIGIVMVILATKRAWFAIISFSFIYYIYNSLVKRGKLQKNTLFLILFISVTTYFSTPYFIELFNARYAKRLEYIITNTENIELNGRFMEYTSYPLTIERSDDKFPFLLFGSEIFNSKDKYDSFAFVFGSNNDRIIHADYAAFLYGTGIVGLFLYMLILYLIYKKNNTQKLYITRFKNIHQLELLSISSSFLIISVIFQGFSEGYLNPITRLLPFLFIGSIMGYIQSQLLKSN